MAWTNGDPFSAGDAMTHLLYGPRPPGNPHRGRPHPSKALKGGEWLRESTSKADRPRRLARHARIFYGVVLSGPTSRYTKP